MFIENSLQFVLHIHLGFQIIQAKLYSIFAFYLKILFTFNILVQQLKNSIILL